MTERALVLRAGTLLAHDAMRTGIGDNTAWRILTDGTRHGFFLADHLKSERKIENENFY